MSATTVYSRIVTASVVAALPLMSGCFTAEFDAEASGVFSCEEARDCPEDELCLAGTCVSDTGPQLELTGPEALHRFDFSPQIVLPLALLGRNLELAPPTGTHETGKGYLEIELDGQVLAGHGITVGSLESGVHPTAPIVLSAPTPGLHRIRVRALRLDGKPYGNPSATAKAVFWVDDGRSHVGIRSPWPGDTHVRGTPMNIDIVALNFEFVDPTGPSAMADPKSLTQGHTHVYINRDYPECLPDCNLDYTTGGSLKPVGTTRTTALAGVLPAVPVDADLLEVVASLNNSGHVPIPAASLETSAEPGWLDGSIYGRLVNDTVHIEVVDP